MDRQLDCLLVAPSAAKKLYQDLSKDISVKQPNEWAGLLANSCRVRGFGVAILDMEADRLTFEETVEKINDANPRFVLFVCTGQNPNASTASMTGATEVAQELRLKYPKYKIAFIGPHVNALTQQVMERHIFIDYAFTNEGVYALNNLLACQYDYIAQTVKGIAWRDKDGVHINPPERLVPQELLEHDLPGIAWDLMPPLSKYKTGYWQTYYHGKERSPFASLYTSLGCPFQCLTGDTVINTPNGDITIKDLAEQHGNHPIYTYDLDKDELLVTDAINIQKTGIKKDIVRVWFDDKTYIDCTPDHKFLTFKNGNQFVPVTYTEKQAIDLKENDRIIAIKKYKNKKHGYISIACRRKEYRRGRLHLEYKIGRKLTTKEQVHHINKDRSDDSLDNLQFTANTKEHLKLHPEISERMKVNNPTKNMTQEWKNNLSKALSGIKRSINARKNYRNSKLGEKNPNFKHGKSIGQKSRLDVNHKVVKVEILNNKEDVYCMYVPYNNWFFANNVLVHNCEFCMINSINRTDNDPLKTAFNFNTFRYWRPEFIIKQFDEIARQGVKYVKIADEMFQLKPKHFLEICRLLKERDYGFNIWAYTRVDTVKEQNLQALHDAGIVWHAIGIEAGNQEIRQEITKGKFQNINIRDIISMIHNHGMDVGANYIFGLGHDSFDTMQQTLDLAIELSTGNANFYCATPLPGSPLYLRMQQEGWDLPTNYSEYGFLSYDHRPSPTANCTTEDILAFRDYAYHAYFEHPKTLSMIYNKYGPEACNTIKNMNQIKLKRKLLVESKVYG